MKTNLIMKKFILLITIFGLIQCTKDNNYKLDIETDTSLLVDYRTPLLGEFDFVTYIHSYTSAGELDTVTPTVHNYDTIYYLGSIDTLAKNRLYIKYMDRDNYYAGCVEIIDTLHNGYGLVTPYIDSNSIINLLTPLGECHNGFDFEGVFESLDSIVFVIGADGQGGGYHEKVIGIRK